MSMTEALASDTGQPETISTGGDIFGTLIGSTEESETQGTSTGQPVTMLNGTQTQGTAGKVSQKASIADYSANSNWCPHLILAHITLP